MHSGEEAPVYPVTLSHPQDAYTSLVINQDVGCNGRLDENGNFIRRSDRIDSDIFSHIINGTGPVSESEMDHESDFGGYPQIDQGTAYSDIDHDGMPDVWETIKGLDPNADDSAGYDLNSSYTNIEVFINGIQVPHNLPPSAPTQLRIKTN